VSAVAYIHCKYRPEGGETWWPVATFEIGSARWLRQVLEATGLAFRDLPSDPSETVSIHYEQIKAVLERFPDEGPFEETWLITDELQLLVDHNDDYERGTVQAWQAFAGSHTANRCAVRSVIWFTW